MVKADGVRMGVGVGGVVHREGEQGRGGEEQQLRWRQSFALFSRFEERLA